MTLFNRPASAHRDRARARRRRFAPRIDALEARALLSTLVVQNTDDSGSASSSRGPARVGLPEHPSGNVANCKQHLETPGRFR
jgi:hypothetical protein